jgi:predicted secreted protein
MSLRNAFRAPVGPVCGAVFLAVILGACAAKDETATARAGSASSQSVPAPTREGVSRRLTAADDGKAALVAVGTTISVELIGVPTAGYAWDVAAAPAFLKPAGEASGPTSEAQRQPGYAGGNHWEVFFFEVVAAGEGELRIEQRRIWEEGGPPDDSFSVLVKAE